MQRIALIILILLTVLLFTDNIFARIFQKNDLDEAIKTYSLEKNNLDQESKNIIESYIQIIKIDLSNGNVKDLIKAYEKLYNLSIKEEKEKNNNPLLRLFSFNINGMPLIIAQLCESNELTYNEKLLCFEKQISISNDYRIRDNYIEFIKKSKSYQKAIDYVVKEIKNVENIDYVKNELMFKLAILRFEYQKELIDNVLNNKNISDWEPNIIPHDQIGIALKEAKNNIDQNPLTLNRYIGIFDSIYTELGTNQEAIDFFEYSINKVKERIPDEKKLISEIQNKIDYFNKKKKEEEKENENN